MGTRAQKPIAETRLIIVRNKVKDASTEYRFTTPNLNQPVRTRAARCVLLAHICVYMQENV